MEKLSTITSKQMIAGVSQMNSTAHYKDKDVMLKVASDGHATLSTIRNY